MSLQPLGEIGDGGSTEKRRWSARRKKTGEVKQPKEVKNRLRKAKTSSNTAKDVQTLWKAVESWNVCLPPVVALFFTCVYTLILALF